MKLIETLIDACNTDPSNPILEFDGFKIEEYIKGGQQGIIVKAKNKINKQFAIKFYNPTDTDPKILNDSANNFLKEIKILASLNHKNIVKIYTGGFATWDGSKWLIEEVLEEKSFTHNPNKLFFYVMDFIDGYDLTQIFPECDESKTPDCDQPSLGGKLKHFENLIKQISRAIQYCHTKGIVHRDIKAKNIIFCKEDVNFVLVDFGFAHHDNSPQNNETIVKVENQDYASIERNTFGKNDMAQFSKMLLKILPIIGDEYSENRFKGIESSLNKGKNDKLDLRFSNMQEFYNTIKQYFLDDSTWRFQLKIDEFLAPNRFGRFDSKLRIPVSGSILLTKEVRDIIDTPEFQRLRGVRQLGPTLFVFPGANHTRFEHSLGVYYLSLKYLERLICIPEFRSRCEPIDRTIKLVAVTSLLHDIGHYPYSHWVEEIREFPNGIKFLKHEERALNIISNSKIKDLIEKNWGLEVKEVTDLISSKSQHDFINSIINCVVDADKLDYLIRDSVHSGVDYGYGIDVERLLDSLHYNSDTDKICLTQKGRSALLSILSARNIMYQEVYWHKTVRACEAMFKRFFFEYMTISCKSKDDEKLKDVSSLLFLSDDEFISSLFEWAIEQKKEKLADLIKPFAFCGRANLYKPAYIYYNEFPKEKDVINRFFRGLFHSSYSEIVNKSNRLADELKKFIPEIQHLDILLEITPIKEDEEYQLQGFEIYNTRMKQFEPHPQEIEPLNTYLRNNRQAYIFCNPKYYKQIKDLSSSPNKTLQNILTTIS